MAGPPLTLFKLKMPNKSRNDDLFSIDSYKSTNNSTKIINGILNGAVIKKNDNYLRKRAY